MRAYTHSIHVDRSPERVWDFLIDLSQAPKWRTMFKSMSVVGGGPLRAGAQVLVVAETHGRMIERASSTLVFDPPHRWVMRSESGGVSGDFAYSLVPNGGGTRVTSSCDLKAHRLLAWIFLPIMARQQRRLRSNQLEAFKKSCEGRTMPG